jgi:hypothetical protein
MSIRTLLLDDTTGKLSASVVTVAAYPPVRIADGLTYAVPADCGVSCDWTVELGIASVLDLAAGAVFATG